jgi:hypothetical protein
LERRLALGREEFISQKKNSLVPAVVEHSSELKLSNSKILSDRKTMYRAHEEFSQQKRSLKQR